MTSDSWDLPQQERRMQCTPTYLPVSDHHQDLFAFGLMIADQTECFLSPVGH